MTDQHPHPLQTEHTARLLLGPIYDPATWREEHASLAGFLDGMVDVDGEAKTWRAAYPVAVAYRDGFRMQLATLAGMTHCPITWSESACGAEFTVTGTRNDHVRLITWLAGEDPEADITTLRLLSDTAGRIPDWSRLDPPLLVPAAPEPRPLWASLALLACSLTAIVISLYVIVTR